MDLRRIRLALVPALIAAAPLALGCSDASSLGKEASDITDVSHTAVENQSIGNCWLYAEASWIESMHLSATGESFDSSQSYWTYWHWFGQIVDGTAGDHIGTGGWFSEAGDILRERGLVPEDKFVPEDATSETSWRQSSALAKMNDELKTGRLAKRAARNDHALVRKVLDEAWGLSPETRAYLGQAFGAGYDKSFRDTAANGGTPIVRPSELAVWYTDRSSGSTVERKTTLDAALDAWSPSGYPSAGGSARRTFQIRVQRALHDRQPVVMVWNVDFNAMEGGQGELQGSFNMTTLGKAGHPGGQGGHMTVLEDYEATTQQYGVLKAGVTLDPKKPEDKAKLDAALLPSSAIRFLRIKNSWGALNEAATSAPGFPGYHDLYLDYLNGPIAWCPDLEPKDPAKCTALETPWTDVVLPPGY